MAALSTRDFSKKLYDLAAIKDGMTAYNDFATMTLEPGDEMWTVSFDAIHEDFAPEVLASEFANYVLAGTIERKR